jgi:phosphate/phosphite/phosphonate ABC transporter binding protein
MNRRLASILFVLMVLISCSLPVSTVTPPTATPTPVPAVTPTHTALPPLPTAELGLLENPLILALPPSSNSQAQTESARVLADQFTQRTGHVVVIVVPDSYLTLVAALEKGNAHIVLLDPFSYELAYQKGLVHAVYAVVKEEKTAYGAQFIASRKGGFKSYFNESSQINLAEAAEALAQFAGKKPCWSDEFSPSGYVVPLGYLNKHLVTTQPAAFVQGHPTVVRSIYAGGICDFGATYVDARKFPSLEDQYPDLMEQVLVVWRIPEIIPYEVLAFSTNMSQDMSNLFAESIPAMLQTTDGKAAFKAAYGIDELQPVNDAYYAEFREYVRASQVELSSLVK